MKAIEIIIRIILGATFIVSGLLKMRDPLTFYGDIQSFGIISGQAALLSAYFVPWLEVVCGTALLFRLRYFGAIVIYFSLLMVFSIFLLSALMRGVDLSCGCFGAGEATNIPLALVRNCFLLAGVVFLGWREKARIIQSGKQDLPGKSVPPDPQLKKEIQKRKPRLFLMIAGIIGIGLTVLVFNADQPVLRNGFIYAAITDSLIEQGFNSGPMISDEIRSFEKPVAFSFLAVPFVLIFGLNVGMKVTSFLSALFFLWMAVLFFKRMNRRMGINDQFISLELGLLFFNPLILYQFWSAYPDILFAGQLLLAFVLTDKIVSEQNKNHVTTIIALGLVIYLAVLTKLYGLILGIACPVYILLHWRSFVRYSTENTVKISCLIGVFSLLGVAVALALLGNNSMLSYGNSQAETYVGYNEFMRGLHNPQQEFMYAFTSLMVTLVLNFHFGLFFLFGRGSRPSLPKPMICFVCVFLVFLLPFGAEVLFNIRFFIPILPFVVVAIVQGVSKFKPVALKRGLFLLYVSAASILILNYNLGTAYKFLLPLNEKIEATVFGEQELFDNLRMKKHLQFAKQIELLNQVIEKNGELYWLSSYYETSTHRVIKRLGIRPDITLRCLLYPTALPEKELYIANYTSFSSWRRRLKKRFTITSLGSDLWRLEPRVKVSGSIKDNFFQPGQVIPLHAELAEVMQPQVYVVNFVLDNKIIASDTVPPYSTTWPAVGIGHHLAEVRVFTNQGEKIVSAPLPLFVGVKAFERSLVEYNDDGEELADGTMYLTSSDLELTVDPGISVEPQMVGMRFSDIQIPQDAFVKKAFIQFTVDEVSTAPADLTLRAEQVLDASKILPNRYNLSRRNTTKNAVRWIPEAWRVEGEQAKIQQTPDLSSLIREVTAQPGWRAGNAIMFLLSGKGYHVARSLDGADKYSDVPTLYIEYRENDQ